jgi:hypothetical protein
VKNLVPWLKANVIWVASLAVAIIALPVALFFSASWNASIKKTVGDDVSAAVGKLQGLRVDYALPAVVPGQQAWSMPKTEPNAPTTEAVVTELKRIAAESASVRDLTFERNKAGKTLLVEGLFPEPKDESSRVSLLTELVAERPKAMEKLLKEAGAGGPPETEKLQALIQTRKEAEERARIGNRVDQQISEEERKQITDTLAALRMEQYQRAASGVRFFADVSAFSAAASESSSSSSSDRGGRNGGGGGGGGTGSDAAASTALPTLDKAWEWQMDQWVRQDIIAALAKANTGAAGQRLSAIDGPVKRLLRVSIVEPANAAASNAGDPSGGGDPAAAGAAAAPAAGGDEKTEVPKDFTRAHTGKPRHSGLYDVIEADVEIICDSARLPAILEAFGRTNLMSVIDLDIEAYDPRADLAKGFAYGGDHLVKANLRVETVWLRGWIKASMPKDVRKKLGIPDDAPPPAAEGAPTEEKPATQG